MTDIQSLVESVLRLDKEATKGPLYVWEIQGGDGYVHYRLRAPSHRQLAFVNGNRADADLFALSRTALPILANEVTRLRAELAEKHEQVCILQSQVDNADVNLEQVRMALKSAHAKELAEERRKVGVAQKLIGKLFTRKTDDLGFYYVSNNMGGINSELSHEIEALAALTHPEREGRFMNLLHDHPSEQVRAAMVRLLDALTTWNRTTGRSNLVIVKDTICDGIECRSLDGSPLPEDITDHKALETFDALRLEQP